MSAVDNTMVGLGDVGSVGATGLLDKTGVVLALTDGGGDTSDAFMRVLAMGTRFSDMWVLFVVFLTSSRFSPFPLSTLYIGASTGCAAAASCTTKAARKAITAFVC